MQQGTVAQLIGVPVCALALLILFAGFRKFFYLQEFRGTLLYVPHLPLSLVPAVTVLVPVLEVFAGMGLLFATRWGIALTVLLLLTTSAVAIVSVLRKQRVPCVCFTAAGASHLSLSTVLRNGVLALIALAPLATPVETAATHAFVPLCGIALVFLYFCVESALSNAGAIASFGRQS